jgi:hypothetical protein
MFGRAGGKPGLLPAEVRGGDSPVAGRISIEMNCDEQR